MSEAENYSALQHAKSRLRDVLEEIKKFDEKIGGDGEHCECKDPRPYDRICVNCMKPIPAEKREYGKYERNQTLRNCLNYCRHRLKKHQNTGLHKIGCQLEFVEQLEREFFPKQPDIQPKPKDRIEELVGLINLDIMSNENRIVAKINELVDFINNRK